MYPVKRNNIRLILLCSFSILLIASNLKAQDSLPQIINRVLPAVVTVITYNGSVYLGQGSGFFISEDGRLVTNRHVIAQASSAKIKLGSGEIYDITHIIAEDKETDIVVLKTTIIPQSIPYLPLNYNIPSIGERIITIGSPQGYERSVSDGIIAAVRNIDGFGKIFQITAPVSPGSSGGPVVNLKGEVIGIVTSQEKDGQNLNFALPANRLFSLSYDNPVLIKEWEELKQLSTPNRINDLFREGMKFVIINEYWEAISYFQEVIKIDASSSETYYQLGMCFLFLGFNQISLNYLSKAIDITPYDGDFYGSRGTVKSFMGDHSGAIQDYSRAILINPKDDKSYYLRGSAKEDTGMYSAAIYDYDIAIRLNSNVSTYYLYRGAAKLELGMYRDAIQDLNRAIQLDPSDDHAYRARAISKLPLNDYQGAISDLSKAIEINPSGFNYYSRGFAKINSGEIYGGCLDLIRSVELGTEQGYKLIERYCK